MWRAGANGLVPHAESLGDVLAALESELALALSADRVRMAINGTLVSRDACPTLADGDEIAFLPPVSGG